MTLVAPGVVLGYWRALGPKRWFATDPAVDADIRNRFGDLHTAAMQGFLVDWEHDERGALAYIIVLDQFSRNIFRASAAAFAADPMAIAAARRAIERGFDRRFANPERRLFYLPFMHSEALADQERCIELCVGADDAEGAGYARIHADIIRRFGRFPHRNALLGRTTTADEHAFLDSGGFAG